MRFVPDWPPKDWRMFLSLVFLWGGGVAATTYAAFALYAIGWLTWPVSVSALRIQWLGWLGAGGLVLVAIVLTSFGFVLGRRAWKMKGPAGLEFESEGGEDDHETGNTAGPAASQA